MKLCYKTCMHVFFCKRSGGNNGETANKKVGTRRTGHHFSYRRRISSVSGTDRHGRAENDCPVTCDNWDEHRRASSCRRHSSAVRPVHLFSRQHAHHQHPAAHHLGDPTRTRTFSMPNAGPCNSVDAVTDVHRRARQQCARDLGDCQSPRGYVRVRSFSTSSRGVKNRGDSFKRREQRTSSSSSFGESNVINGDRSLTKRNDVTTALSAAAAEMRVVVVGDGGVGKRSIISQFTTSEYMHGTTDYSPTASG